MPAKLHFATLIHVRHILRPAQ